ncbi:MAG: hypothetical protein MZW92_39565 [Comamonadaceae bacterium]|nr:hypothetical protein [Comamonadaceae bacterium]
MLRITGAGAARGKRNAAQLMHAQAACMVSARGRGRRARSDHAEPTRHCPRAAPAPDPVASAARLRVGRASPVVHAGRRRTEAHAVVHQPPGRGAGRRRRHGPVHAPHARAAPDAGRRTPVRRASSRRWRRSTAASTRSAAATRRAA